MKEGASRKFQCRPMKAQMSSFHLKYPCRPVPSRDRLYMANITTCTQEASVSTCRTSDRCAATEGAGSYLLPDSIQDDKLLSPITCFRSRKLRIGLPPAQVSVLGSDWLTCRDPLVAAVTLAGQNPLLFQQPQVLFLPLQPLKVPNYALMEALQENQGPLGLQLMGEELIRPTSQHGLILQNLYMVLRFCSAGSIARMFFC
ncbi:hypothetical protein XENOCAPTIV_024363 [Xenoophorus captivus]|uniref:Uncharacterized protein n=1 Tax=Xenoophorus captivus TaxID=1517983 RepID=A0ABV0RIZ1_9TELE